MDRDFKLPLRMSISGSFNFGNESQSEGLIPGHSSLSEVSITFDTFLASSNQESIDDFSPRKKGYKMTKQRIDGGWGWVVVFSAFFLFFLSDGVRFSFGVLYVEFLDTFQEGKATTSWIGSIMFGTYNLLGIACGSIINRYGCRVASCVGSVLAALGSILSMFATSVVFLYFTYGVLHGFGFSLMSLAAIVSVSQYFQARRSLAMGIATCGGGLGGFAMNPFINYLIDTLTWRGALLIQAGLMLNGVVFSCLIRPIDVVLKGADDESAPEKDNHVLQGEMEESFNKDSVVKNNVKVSDRVSANGSETLPELLNANIPEVEISMKRLSSSEQEPFIKEACQQVDGISRYISTTDNFERDENQQGGVCVYFYNWCKHYLIPLRLFKSRNVSIFLMCAFVKSFAYFVPFTYLPDLAVERGVSLNRSAWLASVLGVTGTVCRIFYGLISDLPSIDRMLLYPASVVASGVVTALCPLFNSYELLMFYAISMGFFFSGDTALTPVVAADVAGDEMVAETFGILMSLCGIGALTGVPLAGWLFDVNGDYDSSFILSGVLIIISGLIFTVIKCGGGVTKSKGTEKYCVDLEIVP